MPRQYAAAGTGTSRIPPRRRGLQTYDPVMTQAASPRDGGLGALFESSPDRPVHTSVAAETSFLLGLLALVAAPFSLMHSASLVLAGVGAVCGLVGVATTSRPDVAGRGLAPVGLFCSLAVLVLVGLRYLGVDTAFGDDLLPTILGWLEDLNAAFQRP